MHRESDLRLRNYIFRAVRFLSIVVFLSGAPLGRLAFGQSNSGGADRLTGCLDERPGPQYVLRDGQDLHLVALLDAVGFSVRSFAKYLGHTVEVAGTRTSKEGATLMKVRSIKSMSDTCAPSSGDRAAAAAPTQLKPATASGCLDEEPGPQYALRGDKELKLLMELEPDGFPTQNFARYLGHRVELRGSTYVRDRKTVMKVKSIKDLADHCTPQQ